MDLYYEEARLLDNASYKLILQAKGAPKVIKTESNELINWTITSAEVTKRLHDRHCWIYSKGDYIAEDCTCRGRIAITGP